MIVTEQQLVECIARLRAAYPPKEWAGDPYLDYPSNDNWDGWRHEREQRRVLGILTDPSVSLEERLLLASRQLGMEPWPPEPDEEQYQQWEAGYRAGLLSTARARGVVLQGIVTVICEDDFTLTLEIKGAGTLRLGWDALEAAWKQVKIASYATTERATIAKGRLKANPIPVEWVSVEARDAAR